MVHSPLLSKGFLLADDPHLRDVHALVEVDSTIGEARVAEMGTVGGIITRLLVWILGTIVLHPYLRWLLFLSLFNDDAD